jgi:hypothetical protein
MFETRPIRYCAKCSSGRLPSCLPSSAGLGECHRMQYLRLPSCL